MADLTAANEYFATRLNSQTWDASSDADKTKALATAERQINTLPLAADLRPDKKAYATHEQALFLLSLTDYERERQRSHVLGVIGGSIGNANEYSSAEIVRRKMSGPAICPEALAFLGIRGSGLTRAGGLR